MHKLFAGQLAQARSAAGDVDINVLGVLVSAAYDQTDRDWLETDRSIALMADVLERLNRRIARVVDERTADLREREAQLTAENLRLQAAINDMSQALTRMGSPMPAE